MSVELALFEGFLRAPGWTLGRIIFVSVFFGAWDGRAVFADGLVVVGFTVHAGVAELARP